MTAKLMSTNELADETGVTARCIDYWRRCGYITPSGKNACGSGSRVLWTQEDAARVARISERIEWGMTPQAAARLVDPELPAPVQVPSRKLTVASS